MHDDWEMFIFIVDGLDSHTIEGFFFLYRSDGNQHNLRNAAYEALMEMIKNSPKVNLKLWNIYCVESFANMYQWQNLTLLYCSLCFVLNSSGLLCYCPENNSSSFRKVRTGAADGGTKTHTLLVKKLLLMIT